MGEHT